VTSVNRALGWAVRRWQSLLTRCRHPRASASPQPTPGDPRSDVAYPPPRDIRREAREFLRNVACGAVVFAVIGAVGWLAYQEVVFPLYGRAALALGFERGRPRAQLVDDLHYLKAALEEHHPALYRYQSPEELNRAFARVEATLRDGQSAADLLRAAAPLVAAIGCGHTGLRAPLDSVHAALTSGRVLPLGVRFIDGRCYLIAHYARGVPIPRGAELLAIDGRPMSEVLKILLADLPSDRRDNAYGSAIAETQFPYWYWVFVSRRTRVTVRYRDPRSGDEMECELRARPSRAVMDSFRRQSPELDPYRRPPPMKTAIFPTRGTAYLRLYTFLPQYRPDGTAVLRTFFSELAEHGVATLVLDVRGNGGGPPPVSVDLLGYLLSQPFVYLADPEPPYYQALGYEGYYKEIEPHARGFTGRLVVLIGPGSFSTTGHFLAHLAARDRATFVGQRSGGGALCFDASRIIELPNTGLRLRVATLPFRAGVGELFPDWGIEPDYRVDPRPEDLVAGRDTVLTYLRTDLGIDLRPLGEPPSG
jgi:Peptidase family S41